MKHAQIQTPEIVVGHVVNTLSTHLLSGEQVAWFLSGGSAIDLEVRIAQALMKHDTSRLHIGLIDERYGPIGHKNENYMQLINARFPLPITRVLIGASGPATATAFGAQIEQAIKSADYSLGIFGIGVDGHTAGIKPLSPSVTSTDPAIFYEWDDYQRITITPPTIRNLDEAIIYAVGKEKADTLHVLTSENLPVAEQPAQVLKEVKISTLYTDRSL